MTVKSKHNAQIETVILADKKAYTHKVVGGCIYPLVVVGGDQTLIYSSRCVEQKH